MSFTLKNVSEQSWDLRYHYGDFVVESGNTHLVKDDFKSEDETAYYSVRKLEYWTGSREEPRKVSEEVLLAWPKEVWLKVEESDSKSSAAAKTAAKK